MTHYDLFNEVKKQSYYSRHFTPVIQVGYSINTPKKIITFSVNLVVTDRISFIYESFTIKNNSTNKRPLVSTLRVFEDSYKREESIMRDVGTEHRGTK